MKRTWGRQGGDDGQEGLRSLGSRAGRRTRGFGHLKALVGVLVPLALILLSSPQETQGGGTVRGRPITTAGTTGIDTTTGSTSTSTTSSGTTGTSGTSGTTGTDPDGTGINVGDLQRIEEIRSARSVRVVSGSLVTDLNRHVVRLKLHIPARYIIGSKEYAYIAAAIQAAPSGIGEIGSADPPATPTIVEAGTDGMFASTNFIMGHDGYDLRGFLVAKSPDYPFANNPWDFYPQIGSASFLSGGQITVRVVLRVNDTITPQNSNEYLVESVLDVSKLPCEAVSLDSRKAYGQPNLEGVLPADPNAGLDYIGFKGWTYKGGAFVGNMPQGTGDLSGEGRLQMRYTGQLPTSTYIGACLTAFPTERKAVYGTQSNQSAMQTAIVGLYRPKVDSPIDPNLDAGEDAKWGTRWDIQPQATATNPVDWTKTAYHWFEITDVRQGQYANWQMPYKPRTGTASGEMWRYAALALTPSSSSSAPITWQSFSTVQYQNVPNAIFPISDSAPRIWRVGQVSSGGGVPY